MSRNFKYYVVFGIILLLSAVSCKKYPEDNLTNKQTVTKRLANKTWKIDKFLVNGTDSTNHGYYAIFKNGDYNTVGVIWYYYSTKMVFSDEHVEGGSVLKIYPNPYNNYDFTPSTWKLENKKSTIRMYGLFGSGNFFPNLKSDAWTIRKLTSDAFILENVTGDGQIYRLEMKPG